MNINQLGEYFRRDPALPAVQPLAEQDFAAIASLGMNVVRLTLSWSLLEPERGQVSRPYLDRIRQALAWARAHRVRVLLDLHQDGGGAHVAALPGTRCRAGTDPMTGWDGAPAWASLADATPPCMVTGRDLAPKVSRAFQSFQGLFTLNSCPRDPRKARLQGASAPTWWRHGKRGWQPSPA